MVALAAVLPACSARQAALLTPAPCAARLADPPAASVSWVLGPADDRASLNRWCHAVGASLAANATAPDAPPPLDELVVVTWNAHVGQGRLNDIVDAIREGRFSDGRPAAHFVLLVQEALRRGPEVPPFVRAAMAAGAIGRDGAEDIGQVARALDLSYVYVPSMRNGLGRSEDRGNAIVSTLPLQHLTAIELPFTRQRRVAVGATVRIEHEGRPADLLVMNVHLDPLGSPRSLWVFGNPRQRQMAAVLEEIDRWLNPDAVAPPVAAVLGGDLNLLNGGVREAVYKDARRWATSVVDEDERRTHLMGRLDYLFFRFPEAWQGTTTRGDSRFGSDHYPVAGTFFRTGTD